MARYVYRRNWFGRILLVLVSIPLIAFFGRQVYYWLLPLLPVVAAVTIFMVLWWVAFRRRY
ncbi:hypothetical protein [Actinocorallia longicatena]|uniref:Transmembrane protein PGPGW n=1 Tax=Actinocorallia longicatena TaxID=111803 RepID=A0ABP6QJL8_9ACTN